MKNDPSPSMVEAELAGIDLSLIRESLRYSYDQRAVQHQAALDLALEMRRAGRAANAPRDRGADLSRITRERDVMGGKPTIRGMRVTIDMIVGQIRAGRTFDALLADYPYLEREDLVQALRYASVLEKGDATNPSGVRLTALSSQLNQLAERFLDAEVGVIAGGYAGMLHGSSFVTFDLEMCMELTRDNLTKLHAVLSDLNPIDRHTDVSLSFLDLPDRHTEPLRLGTTLGLVDILTAIEGVGDAARVSASSVDIDLFGRRCRLTAIEDLIRHNQARGRARDLLAAQELRAILELQNARS